MGRPRKLKYGNGEITLAGYTTEEANLLVEGINKLSEVKSLEEGPKVGDIVELKEDTMEVIDMTTLTNSAFDLFVDGKEFHIVTIKYNPVSKAAKVMEMKPAGSFRLAGVNNFKIELVRQGKI